MQLKMAFPGLGAGEGIVQHLLCNVHFMRTLKRRLNRHETKKSQRHLMTALMSKTTEIGCDQEIDLAIQAAQTDSDREYIKKEWKERKHIWAAYARQHSAVLLQADTTNSVENYHSVIKSHNTGKSLKNKYEFSSFPYLPYIANELDIQF
ncbi:hypothetical protein V1522DRAFT_69693 [Lipomyces starkeyi]